MGRISLLPPRHIASMWEYTGKPQALEEKCNVDKTTAGPALF
jgi:hypothetical protein